MVSHRVRRGDPHRASLPGSGRPRDRFGELGIGHDDGRPGPGAPPPHAGDARAALDRLLAAIDKFEAHAEPFAPHFAYGPVDKARYGRVQAMHIAQHLESFRPVPRSAERVAMKGIA